MTFRTFKHTRAALLLWTVAVFLAGFFIRSIGA